MVGRVSEDQGRLQRHSSTRIFMMFSAFVQATLRRNPAPDPRFDPSAMENALGPLHFAVGQKAIFLGRAYYGCVATILPDVSAGLSRKVTRLHNALYNSLLCLACRVSWPYA